MTEKLSGCKHNMPWITEYQRWLSESESLNNAQMVANHFKGTDWTKESISALCGNMRHESSINPDMYEYGYEWYEDRGYGLVQWTPRSKYWNWAISKRLPARSGDSQLSRIDYEVEKNIQWIPISDYNRMTFKQFRTNSGRWSVDYLTEAFTWSYERPNRQAGEKSMADRKAFANRCLNELDWTGTGGGSCIQLAQFPMDYMYITQGEDGDYSHGGGLAMDFVGKGHHYPYYAPFDCECIQRNDSEAILTWKSNGLVMCADGQKRKIVFRNIHDDNLRFNVGDKVNKGGLIGATGNSGQSSGEHWHLDVWEGETFTRTNPLHIYDVFSVGGVEIVQGMGFPWIVSDYQDCEDSPNGGEPPTEKKENQVVAMLLSDALNGWKF